MACKVKTIFWTAFTSLIILSGINAYAGYPYNSWIASPFQQKVFIENKGQFDASTGVSQPILVQTQSGGINIYFSRQGMVYRYDKVTGEDENGSEEKDERKINVNPLSLAMQWVGSNPSVELIANDKVSFYYTYSYDPVKATQGIVASAFKKITYQNLYPGIDIEYIMPEDKEGIKYSVIVHPGADISAVKMLWKGESLSQDVSGNVIIASAMGNFADHSLESHYADGGSISSSFVLSENAGTFLLR